MAVHFLRRTHLEEKIMSLILDVVSLKLFLFIQEEMSCKLLNEVYERPEQIYKHVGEIF